MKKVNRNKEINFILYVALKKNEQIIKNITTAQNFMTF